MRVPDGIDRYYFPAEMRGAERRYTLHVDFTADDDLQARILAEMYTRGLNYMRLEVDFYTARVSSDANWDESDPVICLAPGPDPSDICSDIFNHSGTHNGPGASHVWGEDEVPRMPDSIPE